MEPESPKSLTVHQTGATPVSLLVPTPASPPAELPPAETPPGSGPIWSTAVQLATPTAVPTATRPSLPTRTPEVIPFGGVPAAPLGEGGEEPRANPPAEILSGPEPSVPGSSSGVLWGGAALALIGAATAIALDQARRRREEEARQREEMERRNAAQRAREAAERARIAAAAAARAQQVQVSPDYGAIVGAALGAAGAEERLRAAQDRRVERREEEMEAAEQPAAPAASGSDDLIWDALFTLANAVGTLMVVSGGFSGGTTSVLGGVLLVANVVRQVTQITGDYSDFQAGRMSREVFIWNTAWNVADAIPGVGVATGLIQVVNEHILPWARSYGGR